jgi:ABC-2 type transport system permease protein
MRQFGLVFGYSFKERLRSKSFTYMTLIMILIISGLVFLPKLIGDKDSIEGEIAVLDTTGIVTTTDGFKDSVSSSYGWRSIEEADLEKEQQRLQEKDGVLGIVRIDQVEGKPVLSLTVNKLDDAPYINVMNGYVQSLYTMSEMNKLPLDAGQREQLTSTVQVQVTELENGSKSRENNFIIIYCIMLMLFFLIYMFGGNVAISVSVEKGSRVQEILITKVKPVQLLFGKVFGVGLAGILQFAIIMGAGYLLITLSGSSEVLDIGGMKLDFSVLDGKTILLLSIFFVLGYFFYAALFAAAGSLVSRSEEVNQVTMPISLLLMAGMMLSIFAMGDTEGTLALVGSYIPFTTSFVMFVRVGMSDPSTLEILIPTVILFISSIGACWLSAKIYQVGVLLYGQKPTLKLVYRSLRSSRRDKHGNRYTTATSADKSQ